MFPHKLWWTMTWSFRNSDQLNETVPKCKSTMNDRQHKTNSREAEYTDLLKDSDKVM